MTEPEPVTS